MKKKDVGSAIIVVVDWETQAILFLVRRTDVYCAPSCDRRTTLKFLVTAL